MRIVQQVFYSPMSHFFKIDGVIASISITQKFPHCDVSIVIFDGCWIYYFFTKISSYIKVSNLGKIWRANISYLMSRCVWVL